MKIRCGFVSNSSSCSFTICQDNLTSYQVYSLFNHIKKAKELKWPEEEYELINEGDCWDINMTGDLIKCEAKYIDTFDLYEFAVQKLDIDPEEISLIKNPRQRKYPPHIKK